ncbi:class II aldolase/adducin family protein [Halodesulfurarchaeum sp.]|uniref:class II aldolase/adducin family protein n=1 Tax=Halodesulfurarchaeum sp. TaxID=1980530 RepID=UPI002FC3211D
MSDSADEFERQKSDLELREAIHDGLPKLADLTPGRTGNLSLRSGDRVGITPSGIPYADIEESDIPILSIEGSQLEGERDPSSETPMHLGIYRALDIKSLVHVHAPWSTTLAVLGEELPPVHYMLAAAGGTVPLAPYAPFGTSELAEKAVSAMTDSETKACLLANHGLIAGGTDVVDAVETTIAVESTARLYIQARAVGDPVELSESQVANAVDQFDSYGQSN